MSLLGKKWLIKNDKTGNNLLEVLLSNRGIFTDEDKQEYLRETEKLSFHDPFLFKDMKKAVDRIEAAIKNKERIIIFGDYDVDGISGTAILFHAIKKLGGTISYRLPHRVEDGYGLSAKFIGTFAEAQAKLVITVDCGIANYKEIDLANEKGINVIITDHHTVPGRIPDAYAIIHPKVKDETYPFDGLTGAGVALKLAQALFQNANLPAPEFEKLLDLASLGTVADMGPLKGENRLIVRRGLLQLKKSQWKGLELLKEVAGINADSEISTETIGFHICPRINAAGRIDTPYLALQLLLHELEQESSRGLAQKLEELNQERREMTQNALLEVTEFIETLDAPKIIIKANADWHVGIVGLIAGRIVEKYAVPAIILQDFGEHLVASCRSPQFFNIIEALTAHKEFFEGFGGHEQAAGFTITKSKFEDFVKALTSYTEEKLKERDLSPVLQIDCALKEDHLNFDTIGLIEKMKPFGIDNQKPVFLIEDCEVHAIKTVGKENTHLKLSLKKGDKYIEGIWFSFAAGANEVRQHQKIDIAGHLETNTWNGKDILQLKLVDIRVRN